MIDESLFKKVSILGVIGVLVALSLFVIWPIGIAVVTGLIMAYIFYPVYKKILHFVKEKNISAIIIILLVIFLIFIPLWFLLPFILKQVFNAYLFLQNAEVGYFIKLVLPADSALSQSVSNSVDNFISGLVTSIYSAASRLVLDLPNIILQIVIVFFVFFFGMRDGHLLMSYVRGLSPFSKSAEEEFIKKFKDITNSVIYGHIVVGAIQGVVTGIGLFIFGVDQALLLTVLAILASIIPVLGAWLIWVPASVYLIATNHVFAGVGLFLFGAIIVSWIDNVIRPYIVSRKSNLSSGVVVIGMFGGLLVFGILGLIIGPLILAYFLLILDAYRNKKFKSLFSN